MNKKMIYRIPLFAIIITFVALTCCSGPQADTEVRLVLTGQALIKKDPRLRWEDPFGTLRPILDSADIAFTNFEMAVISEEDRCGLPPDYEVSFGSPDLPKEDRPGNTGGPHAVAPEVMNFLADLGFNLMSLSNNHAWDLGKCGVAATIKAAEENDVSHAGTGLDILKATAPSYLTVGDFTIALVAATTSLDERSAILPNVNGVWTGRQDDWDRNISAVRKAASNADFVLFYHHFQIDIDDFDGMSPGDTTRDGHIWVGDLARWQSEFAYSLLDAGASIYIGNGDRAFDGIEIYNGKPLIRQIGGLAYQGLRPNIGAYDKHRPWEGVMAEAIISKDRILKLEFLPLDLDEGETYRSDFDDLEFLSRRGLAQLATGEQAQSILQRFSALSAKYGTEMEITGIRARVKIE